jgi:Dicer dimerisation domain
VLYMPETCKNILRKVNPKSAFVKKKDAENHVALLAIKKLREKGHLDKHLFPMLPGDNSGQVLHLWEQLNRGNTSTDSISNFSDYNSNLS